MAIRNLALPRITGCLFTRFGIDRIEGISVALRRRHGFTDQISVMPTRIYKTNFAAFIHMNGIVDETFAATVTAGKIAFKDVHFVPLSFTKHPVPRSGSHFHRAFL